MEKVAEMSGNLVENVCLLLESTWSQSHGADLTSYYLHYFLFFFLNRFSLNCDRDRSDLTLIYQTTDKDQDRRRTRYQILEYCTTLNL